jgi:hypothetical protein
MREERRSTGRLAAAAVLAGVVVAVVPADAAASCGDILGCASSCYDDSCVQQCAAAGDGASQSAFYGLASCLSSYCGSDGSDSCARSYCSYQLEQCAADGGGFGGPGIEETLDNITLKIGGGYAFEIDSGFMDMTVGWERLWLFGPAQWASSFQLGIDALMYVIGLDEIAVGFGGAFDLKYYFGTDVTVEPGWFTFGLGAMIGGGGLWNGYELDGIPFVLAAPEVSLQWIHFIGGGFDIYGGVVVVFQDDITVAPIVGARGVIDFGMNTTDE